MKDRNTLNRLAVTVLSSAFLAGDHSAMAFMTEPVSQVDSIDVQKHSNVGEIELIVDNSDADQAKMNEEKFNQGLNEVNRSMPRRTTSSLELDVTEMFRAFLPKCVKIEDAIIDLQRLGLIPQRDKGGDHTYFTYFSVPYDRLSGQARTNFMPGDRLVINYTAASPGVDAEILELTATLLNDRFL